MDNVKGSILSHAIIDYSCTICGFGFVYEHYAIACLVGCFMIHAWSLFKVES
jgi:hypothetical protein